MPTPNRRRANIRSNLSVIITATVAVMLLFLFFPVLRHSTFPHYLFWHTALQAVTIVMAAQIFTLTLSAYKRRLPTNIVVIGAASLAIAFFGFSHLLLHPGMPLFFDAYYQYESFYFWILSRSVIAVLILFISIYPWTRRFRQQYFVPLIVLLLLFIAWLNAWAFYFPASLDGFFTGPEKTRTVNTVGSLIFLLMLGVATVLLFKQTKNCQPKNICLFFTAAALFFLYELISLTHPAGAPLYHLIIHIYKLAALYYLYRAVFNEVVLYPYEQLNSSRQQLHATLKASPDLIFEVDGAGLFQRIYSREDARGRQITQAFLGKTIDQVLNPEYAHIVQQGLITASQQGVAENIIIARQSPLDQQRIWLELSISRIQTEDDQPERYIAIARDITSKVKENEQLKLLSEAVHHNPSAIYILNEQLQIQFVNKTFSELSGYRPEEALGKTMYELAGNPDIDNFPHHFSNTIKAGEIWQDEIQRSRKNGECYLSEIAIYPIMNDEGRLINYLIIENDISETRRITEDLQRISNFDRLTGLPNQERLLELLKHLQSQQKSIAILWINLDHFKNINDALGYQVGNVLLKEIADRLSNLLRPQDILARPNGDNFVMLMPGAQHNTAAAKAQKIFTALKQPLHTTNRPLVISASIGIAMYPWDSRNTSTLLSQAETAMHRIKRESRGDYCFFKLEMHEKNAKRLILSMALKLAIQNQELYLVYQPQLNLQTGEIIGVEALLRWQTPVWGNIPPALFIPLAEESGDIIEIGRWVIHTAIEQMQKWQQINLPIDKVSINISALQFEQADFLPYLKRTLDEHGVNARHLELELTEAVAMKDPEYSASRIEELEAAEISIAIDDFGTGYSSLSYLKRFDIDTLKIDRSFIKDIHKDPDNQAIVNAIINMAHHLGLQTIAEGVERRQELDFLRASGCHAAQGFYFSKPLPKHELEQFLIQSQNQNTQR